MQKKYVGIILGLLSFVILTSGCIYLDNFTAPNKNYGVNDTSYNTVANVSTKTFSAYGVSFKYPYNWKVDTGKNPDGSDMISAYEEVAFKATAFNIQIMNDTDISEQTVIAGMQKSIIPGGNKTASYTITLDNTTAYEDVYVVDNPNFSKLMRFTLIYFVKDGKSYLITLQASDKNFDKEKAKFGIILNSLKVQ
ncbi:PsbP-related protein [Methanobacterium sp.]|jgi:hypothetical protein|uniref:PsbP-related protein n=1 Tax=Methanobacterium sp. TaxID=2164 RepID=UPI0031591ED0